MKPAVIQEIFTRFRAANSEPKSELEYVNAYTLLVAVVLSAQATDAGVNKATRVLFKKADTPEKMAALGEDKLRDAIKTIGLYRNKAKNVIALSRDLIEKHGGEVPASREALEALPGVGRKTANVVLGTAFGIPTGVVVDTHVTRISRRLGMTRQKDAVKIEQDLMEQMPIREWIDFSHRVIHHGRRICTARKPDCEQCSLKKFCPKIGVDSK